jgi:hypothetical protein
MRSLSDPDFLDLWERGRRYEPLDQGLLALAAAHPETSYDHLADWPLGRRNQALARLRRDCFGSTLQAWTACARCGEKLEFEMDCGALAGGEIDGVSTRQPVVVNGHSFRLPTSRDVARLSRETDPRRAAIRLLEACRLDDGEAHAWGDDDLEKVGDGLAAADPMAETLLTLTCPECGSQWEEALNISAFVWTEIEARARRLLMESHTLASAYGWTEREIFSLSGPRRALYMEMVTR